MATTASKTTKEPKQEIYLWEGRDASGKTVKGEMAAPGDAVVKAKLRRRGITPTRVRKRPRSLFSSGGGKVKPADVAVFSRQLATMMSSGVPLVQSFEILASSAEKPAMRALLTNIRLNIEAGGGLAQALAQHPKIFDPLFINLIAAGEAGGILEQILDALALYKEKTEALKSKIKGAMFYPVAVIVVAFIITAILLLYVIPQFEELFQGFGADLPALTRLVINLSQVFQEHWALIFGSIIGTVVGVLQLKRRSKRFAALLDRLLLRVPIVGEIVEKAAIARFARTLSTMFAAGVPLVEALSSVARATGNVVFEEACHKIRQDVSTGTQMALSMREAGVFPNMVVQMTAIGEESGNVDGMLAKVAEWYEREVDDAVESLTSLLEPIIMAILGVLIGGLVIAMYLPIFKMGQVV